MKNNEIGSNFIFENVNLNRNSTIYKHIDKFGTYFTFFDSGRNALRWVVNENKKKSVLLPNYLCESIIQPFIQDKYKILFYDIDNNLSPIINSIVLSEDIGIFLHIGYFGYNSNSNLENIIKFYKKNGTIIIEDISHKFFSNYKNNFSSDYYICSLRKWLGVPDGGILITNKKELFAPKEININFLNALYEANTQKLNYTNGIDRSKKYLITYKNAEKMLDDCSKSYGISKYSLDIINNYDFENMIKIRKENFKYLHSKLKKFNMVIDNNSCDDNIVPLFIPIFLNNMYERNNLQKFLIENGIFTPIHWNIPQVLYDSKINNDLYCVELSIPCDQRYSIYDMDIIAQNISIFKGL